MDSKLNIELEAKLSVDRKTAMLCLKFAEMFCNANKCKIIECERSNGEYEYYFENVEEE